MINRDVAVLGTLVASKGLVAVSNLVVTVLVSRILGPKGFGQWVLVIAAGTFLHTALVNWTHPGTTRFGCEEWVTTGKLDRTLSARLPLLLFSVALAATLVVTEPFAWLTTVYGINPSWSWLVGIYAVNLWMAAEGQATLQARERLRRQALVASFGAGVSVCALQVPMLIGWNLSLSDVVVVVATTGSITWGVTWALELASSRSRLVRPTGDEMRRQLRYGAPLFAGFFVGYVSVWGNHILLRHLSSVEMVGYFGLSFQVYVSLIAANGMLATLALPRLVAAQARSSESARNYLEQAVPTVMVLWAMGTMVGIAALPPLLVMFSGAEFAPSAMSLVVLCAMVPSSVITSLYVPLFSLQERHARTLMYGALGAVLNLTVSAVLIPSIGAVGAAVGTVISSATAQVAYLHDQHRFLAVRAGPVLAIWTVVVVFGVAQIATGTHLGWRLTWALTAVACVGWTARITSAVSRPVVQQLFMGALSPLGRAILWALVPASARSI